MLTRICSGRNASSRVVSFVVAFMSAVFNTQVWHLLMDLIAVLNTPALVEKRLEYIALRHMSAEVTEADVEMFKAVTMEASLLHSARISTKSASLTRLLV